MISLKTHSIFLRGFFCFWLFFPVREEFNKKSSSWVIMTELLHIFYYGGPGVKPYLALCQQVCFPPPLLFPPPAPERFGGGRFVCKLQRYRKSRVNHKSIIISENRCHLHSEQYLAGRGEEGVRNLLNHSIWRFHIRVVQRTLIN